MSLLGAIKCLFEYLCKRQDRISVQLVGGQNQNDEIAKFQDARCVSATKAL